MLGLYALDALKGLELRSVDTRFSVRGAQPQPDDLAVVAIDTKTFNKLGLQWPFPRRKHAQVLDNLRKDGAKAIAFDVQFTEQTDPRDDNALIDAVGRAEERRARDDRGRERAHRGASAASRRCARSARAPATRCCPTTAAARCAAPGTRRRA